MKLSKEFNKKIRINLIIVSICIALFLGTLVIFKLADFSVDQKSALVNNSQAEINRLENTDTITYIYDAEDLVAFRDAVNAGDNYTGKSVYVMADIDLSTVCSSTLGSWTPIGSTGINFAGTFDGNYHTISNLYIYNNTNKYVGLFSLTDSSIIKNVILNNAYVYCYNNGDCNTGGIAGGTINASINNCMVMGNVLGRHPVGGIVGLASGGTIVSCINEATVKAMYINSTFPGIAGGIAGMVSGLVQIDSCYNLGQITANSSSSNSVGGIIGHISSNTNTSSSVKNCYNIGKISVAINKGGILGRGTRMSFSNNYWLSGCGATYGRAESKSNSGAASVTADNLKTYTVKLGSNYAYDVYGVNSGYPVFAWQNKTTVMQLNKNQEYIKVGENLKLNVVESDEITQKIGTNYANNKFKWTSTNEDVAIVNEEGIVTGISDGYTTIYAYHEDSGLYAMAVINVAKDFTNPQVETGNGFISILKSDGTVWTIGNNSSGQLGNGTTENTKVPVQVKIDEDTNLSNIVKIVVGTEHVVALAKDGKVYAWGANTYGQLGQNNTISSNYAKVVLGTDGVSYLSNIVDISCRSLWNNGSR